MLHRTPARGVKYNRPALVLVAALVCLILAPPAGAQGPLDGPLATANVSGSRIEWQPTLSHDGMLLTLTGPGGFYLRQEFAAGETAYFEAAGRPDGPYTYELKAVPVLDDQTRALIESARELLGNILAGVDTLNSSIEALNTFPFVSIPTAELERIENLSQTMDNLQTQAQDLRTTLDQRRSEIIQGTVAALTTPTSQLISTLDEMQTRVSNYSQRLGAL